MDSGRQIVSRIRPPRAEDAAQIWELVQKSPSLDTNTPYAYLLLTTDFAATGAIAEAGDEVVGFVLGYRPATRLDAWFVWQIGVRDDHCGQGLATALLGDVLKRSARENVAFLEATVTPSNQASWSLFRGFARRTGAECREVIAFPSHLFPDGGHEEEVRIRIGPLSPALLPAQQN